MIKIKHIMLQLQMIKKVAIDCNKSTTTTHHQPPSLSQCTKSLSSIHKVQKIPKLKPKQQKQGQRSSLQGPRHIIFLFFPFYPWGLSAVTGSEWDQQSSKSWQPQGSSQGWRVHSHGPLSGSSTSSHLWSPSPSQGPPLCPWISLCLQASVSDPSPAECMLCHTCTK